MTVTAEDDGGLSDALTVDVTVADVEEDGVITLSTLRGWADTRTDLRADLDDGDGGETSITWQWALSSNRSSWTDIATATSSTYRVGADDANQYLRVTASYTDDRDTGKMASGVLAGRIGDVRPTTNELPAFADTTDTRSVGQGTSAGRSIGAPVRATDEDPGDVLTYSLSGQDADKFDIDPATGQLRTKDVLDYDPQGTNDYSVTVNVHDGFNQNYSNMSTSVDASMGDPVAATHPNDDVVTYSLSGANAALFTVDEETGQIRLGQAVTLELGQTYTVNLTATDSSGMGAIIIVVIEIAEGLGDPYDPNRNGIIEMIKALAAVSNYFAGVISKPLVLALVSRYLACSAGWGITPSNRRTN